VVGSFALKGIALSDISAHGCAIHWLHRVFFVKRSHVFMIQGEPLGFVHEFAV